MVYAVSLRPENIAGFVFWSKNFTPFIPILDKISALGYRNFLFNFTITGLPDAFEPNILPPEYTIPVFQELSQRYGKKAIFWRFDPIIISNITPEIHYIEKFKHLADKIALYTQRCIFSFACFYHKVKRSLKNLEAETGVVAFDPEIERKKDLAEKLAEMAKNYNLLLQSCCGEYLEVSPGISKAHCVDGRMMSELMGGNQVFYAHPSRPECGCDESTDIGQYGTCKGGCRYCYAN
jgi:DNA repair photolyase